MRSPGVGHLISKGLIYLPEGAYDFDAYPFTFYDFAWKALKERQDDILRKETEYEKKREKRR